MAFWSRNGAVFPPRYEPRKYEYASPDLVRQCIDAGRPIRAERHNRHSIATIRRYLVYELLRRQGLRPSWGAPFY